MCELGETGVPVMVDSIGDVDEMAMILCESAMREKNGTIISPMDLCIAAERPVGATAIPPASHRPAIPLFR